MLICQQKLDDILYASDCTLASEWMNAHLNRQGMFLLKRERNHPIIAFLPRPPFFSGLKNDNKGQPTCNMSPTSCSMYWCDAARRILVAVDFLCFFVHVAPISKTMYCFYCIDSPALWTKCPSTRFLVPGWLTCEAHCGFHSGFTQRET